MNPPSRLNEVEFRTLLAVAEAGGNPLNHYDTTYQALINQLLSQNKDVLLLNLLDALRRLKKSGEQELAEKNIIIQRLEQGLKERELALNNMQAQMQTLHGEVQQFRTLAQQQSWQQAGFSLSPSMQPQNSPALMAMGSPGTPYMPPFSIADYGRQVLVHSYTMS